MTSSSPSLAYPVTSRAVAIVVLVVAHHAIAIIIDFIARCAVAIVADAPSPVAPAAAAGGGGGRRRRRGDYLSMSCLEL